MPTSSSFNLIFRALIFVRSTMARVSCRRRSLLWPSPPRHLGGMFVFKTKEPGESSGITYQNMFPAEIKNTQTSLLKARYYLLLLRTRAAICEFNSSAAASVPEYAARAPRRAVSLGRRPWPRHLSPTGAEGWTRLARRCARGRRPPAPPAGPQLAGGHPRARASGRRRRGTRRPRSAAGISSLQRFFFFFFLMFNHCFP